MHKKLEKTVRIPFGKDIKEYLISKNFPHRKLPKLVDKYLKPTNTTLNDFHPKDIVFRLRSNLSLNTTKLELITVNYTNSSYQHKNYLLFKGKEKESKKIIKLLSLEEYLLINTNSILWEISKDLHIIEENFNNKHLFFKVEAVSNHKIQSFIEQFSNIEIIKKNIAWLLCERKRMT